LDFRFRRGKLGRNELPPGAWKLEAIVIPQISEEVVDAETFYAKVSDGRAGGHPDVGIPAGRLERPKTAPPQAFDGPAHRKPGYLSTFTGDHQQPG
jgi:hypothetical protein